MNAVVQSAPTTNPHGEAVGSIDLDNVYTLVMRAADPAKSFPQTNAQATIVHLPRARLVRSKMNVRSKVTDVKELAALIKAQGLLQNLIGYKQTIGGVETGMVEIVAGGRRLAAIDLNLDADDLPPGFEIAVLLVTEEEAIDVSLAENSGREDMHPADMFDAMMMLSEKGRTVEDIAVAFGVEPIRVTRRLKLAKVSPRLMDLYRNDKANYEQMTALALVDCHEKQEKAWDALPEYQRNAHNLKRLLVDGQVNVKTDTVAKFVGVKAFEKAGGSILRDLFSQSNDGYITDLPLLEGLAIAKLNIEVEKLKETGTFAWVEAILRAPHDVLSKYTRVMPKRAAPSAEQRAELGTIDAALDKIECERDDADEDDEGFDALMESLDQQEKVLDDRRDAIESSLVRPDPELAAIAGAIVSIGYDGTIKIDRDLVRPEDLKALKAVAKGKTDDSDDTGDTGDTDDTKPARSAHSERLFKTLTSHRTMALAAEMMNQPHVALAVITNELLNQVFMTYEYDSFAKIRSERPSLSDEVKGTPAALAVDERGGLIKELLSDIGEASQLEWLIALPSENLMSLMAFCVARSVDTVRGKEETLSKKYVTTANALGLDMRKWWSATSGAYFDHVSKARAVEVVTEAVTATASIPLTKMKKAEASSAAERLVSDARWLPEALRTAASQSTLEDAIAPLSGDEAILAAANVAEAGQVDDVNSPAPSVAVEAAQPPAHEAGPVGASGGEDDELYSEIPRLQNDN